MERQEMIRDLNQQIESLARLHLRHGLYDSEGFRLQRERVERLVREHRVNVRQELDPQIRMLYKRYFD